MTLSPERRMWQSVIEQAFSDAMRPDPKNQNDLREKRIAANWIRSCGPDFRLVCDLAGMDPDFLSDAFNAGRVDREVMRSSSKLSKEKNYDLR